MTIDMVKLANTLLMAPYPKMPPHRCDDGIIHYIEDGDKEKAEFCTCARGRELKAEHDDALEAKGAERDQWRNR